MGRMTKSWEVTGMGGRLHVALGEPDDIDIKYKRLPGFRKAGVLVSFSQSVVLVD